MQENSVDGNRLMIMSRRSDIKSEPTKSPDTAKDTSIVHGFNEEGVKNQYSLIKFINATEFETEKERINTLESEVSWLLKKIGK